MTTPMWSHCTVPPVNASAGVLRHSPGRLGAALLAMLCASPAYGQGDQTAVFQHGFLSDGNSWTTTANRLQNTFTLQPVTPTTPWRQPFAAQADNQDTQIPAGATNLIAVGHSNGGQVSRVYNLRHGRSTRLLTLGSPNWGVPLADAALANGDLFNFPVAVANDIAGAFDYYANEEAIAHNAYYAWFLIDALNWMYAFTAQSRRILGQYGFVASAIAGTYAPALYDMAPGTSQYFNANTGVLNSPQNLQREAAAFSSRVGVRALFGYPQDMVFYTLLPSYAGTLSTARQVSFVLAAALYDYYENELDPQDPYYYELHDYAYLWGNVALDMVDIDLWWLGEIGALDHFDAYGVAYYIDSDGILPITTQRLPGFTGEYTTCCTSHTQEIADNGVYQQLDNAFRYDFAVPLRLTASVGGPSYVSAGETDMWTVGPSGGSPPYSYAWSIDGVVQPSSNSSSFTYTNSGSSFNVSVVVTDALARTASAGQPVTVASTSCGAQIVCD